MVCFCTFRSAWCDCVCNFVWLVVWLIIDTCMLWLCVCDYETTVTVVACVIDCVVFMWLMFVCNVCNWLIGDVTMACGCVVCDCVTTVVRNWTYYVRWGRGVTVWCAWCDWSVLLWLCLCMTDCMCDWWLVWVWLRWCAWWLWLIVCCMSLMYVFFCLCVRHVRCVTLVVLIFADAWRTFIFVCFDQTSPKLCQQAGR